MKISKVKNALKELKTILPYKDGKTDIEIRQDHFTMEGDTIFINTDINGFIISVRKSIKEDK